MQSAVVLSINSSVLILFVIGTVIALGFAAHVSLTLQTTAPYLETFEYVKSTAN